MNRDSVLEQIREQESCDVVVIGGGATGTGIALDGRESPRISAETVELVTMESDRDGKCKKQQLSEYNLLAAKYLINPPGRINPPR